jgi:hypothetical protein
MDASQLYGLAPEDFTAARNELVKRLRAAGRRDQASGVARLRKPPATVWALNQVARQSPEALRAVFDAGARLRAAMDAALGGDASSVRAARADERQAVAAAVAAAGRHLEGSGHPATDAARRRMEATLRAAMVDDSVAERLGQGVLDADQDAPGFGFGGSAGSLAGETAPAVEPDPDVAAEEAARQAAERRTRLIEEADRLASRAGDLEATAREAEAVALRARQAADEATQRATEARARAEEGD